jgi:Predicted oxidoreductases (related to aryl-alcohol dehydrogenases)
LTLGTAQLGLKYGAANRTGKPSFDQAVAIVHEAIAHGVTTFDCARGYGDAETRLGVALQGIGNLEVVTKLDPLATLSLGGAISDVMAAVDASIQRSCQELQLSQLPTVLLHRWSHRHVYDDAIWRRLLDLKSQGLIQRLGASVYTPDEAIEALHDPDVVHLQLPFNVLDWRWKASGVHALASARDDVVIHARSALLQGILAHEAFTWPQLERVDPQHWLRELDQLVDAMGRQSRADLCLAFVRSQPWITSTVVGVDTLEQLEANVALFEGQKLTAEQCVEIEERLAGAPEHLLNPALWPST